MESFWRDMRYAARQIVKQPGFAFVAVLTLALGIGANTAIFSIINTTVLEPLPYADAERLVRVRETTPRGHNFSASEPNYLDFRDRSRGLAQLAALKDHTASLTGAGEPVRLDGLAVTHDFFSVLGATPALGRSFLAEEDRPGGDNAVVMLSHRLWQQRFDGDPRILGRDIILEGRAHTVVGVMPADFRFLEADFWLPLAPDPRSDRGDHWLAMIGKLAPGVPMAQAEAELKEIAARIGKEHPHLADWSVRMETLSDWLVGPQFRLTAWLLFGAVGFLLLIACVNLANLLFARTHQRQAEIGIRAALGAGRLRLVRQLLTEILLLCLLGAAVGLVLAHWGLGALQIFDPGGIPRLDEIRIDDRVLGFTLALTLVTSLVFGLVPALRASRVDFNETLKQGGRSGFSRGHARLRDTLVIGQIALAMLLLVGAGLLIRSFTQLLDTDPGFEPKHVLAVQLQLGDDKYPEPWQKVVFFSSLAERLEGLPGVVSAGATSNIPLSGGGFMNDVTPVELAAQTGPGGYMQVAWRTVTPGFFETLGIPLLQGRLFTEADPWNGPRLVVITETMAQRLWPDERAVGREFYWGGTDGTPMIVAGVVGDYQDVAIGDASPGVMFIPYNQLPWPGMTLAIKTAGEVAGVADAVRNEIRRMDATFPVPQIRPLEQQVSASVAAPRFRTQLLTAFALIALLLAAVGIYGVMAFNVSQRTREVGLRLALGARPEKIAGTFLLDGARLSLLGAALGLLGTWALTRFLEGLLYATAPLDTSALVAATLLLGGVALAASHLPARRAARVDPMMALREE